MVICERHKFIYLRVPKNASTSLATFFIKNCCSVVDRYTGVGDAQIQTKNVDQNIISKYKDQYRFIHLTLQELIDNKIVKPEELETKKVISVIRNPFERQLSLFFFKNRNTGALHPEDFRSQFRQGYHHDDGSNRILQSEYPVYNGVSYGPMWKYEDVARKLEEFVQENFIQVKSPIERYKSQYKKKNKVLDDYYDEATRKAVEKYYAKDFEVYESL